MAIVCLSQIISSVKQGCPLFPIIKQVCLVLPKSFRAIRSRWSALSAGKTRFKPPRVPTTTTTALRSARDPYEKRQRRVRIVAVAIVYLYQSIERTSLSVTTLCPFTTRVVY